LARVILLDGGTSLELLRRSANKAPRHWSAEYLITEPDLVRAVHLDYIRAGARVVTTNTYSASFTRMAMVMAEDRVPELQRVACDLARAARDRAGAAGAEEILAELRDCPPAPGFARVEIPGERERALRDASRPLGIAVPAPTLARIQALAAG
jgi:S-methylmethionine-dependent homocysteine/selenocysteine methylase